MTMVERVAEAIALWDGSDWKGMVGGRESVRNRYRNQARAAIEALREPTEEMRRAFYIDNYGDADKAWLAMIDEALR